MENNNRDVFKASHMRQAEIGSSNADTDATAHSAQVGFHMHLHVECNVDPQTGFDQIMSIIRGNRKKVLRTIKKVLLYIPPAIMVSIIPLSRGRIAC